MSRTTYACLLLVLLASCGPEIFNNNRLQVKGKVVTNAGGIPLPMQITVATKDMLLSQGITETDGTFDLIAIKATGRLEVKINQNPIDMMNFLFGQTGQHLPFIL